MKNNFDRRNVLKLGMGAALCGASGLIASPLMAQTAPSRGLILRAGIVTDMHKTSQANSATRKYSAALPKMKAFIKAMNKIKPDFLIELGDFVDTLAPGTNPAKNLQEIEKVFTSYSGPTYHVLGNHEFDNLKRDFVLKSLNNTGIPQGKTWYSWDANGIHFIVLDADYTPNEYRPYDMNTPEDSFWTWKDTCIPPQEVKWLKQDLRSNTLPTVVFTHQTLDRVDEQEHNIKNASEIRAILEKTERVLAVISGHDHQGGYSNIKGIHYIVLTGNVGVNDTRPWSETSLKNGFDIQDDNQFALLEISSPQKDNYNINIVGYGRQPSYTLERKL